MYQQKIRKAIGDQIDARHVEAWMRSEIGPLDSLSPLDFFLEAHAAAWAVIENGEYLSERLAATYGL